MRYITTPLFIIFLVMLPVLGMSQPGDPGGDPDVPITGIELLLGGGALLGLRQALKSRKEKS